MTLLSFQALTARNNATLYASTSAGVRSVSYWKSGVSTAGAATATFYARVRQTSGSREPSEHGRREPATIECFVNKSTADGGYDTVDRKGSLGMDGRIYKIHSVENGDSLWRVCARDDALVDSSRGKEDFFV